MIEWHEDHILSDDSNPNEQANSHVTPSPIANTSISQQSIIHLAKNPTDPAVSVDKLIKDYWATLFPGALDRYLRLRHHRLIQNTSSMINIPPGAYDRLKRLSVPVWHHVKFVHANVQGLDFIEDTRDAAHCYPELPKKKKGTVAKARFDTVLVNEKGEAQVTGTAGLRVAQVRAVFKVPDDICETYLGRDKTHWPNHVAYIEWFSWLKASPDRDHRMFLVSRKQNDRQTAASADVVDISSFTRSCHLIPQFFYNSPVSESPAKSWTSDNVLEECEMFFLNNWLSHQSYQIIW
ncbi:hypothetical protein FRC02_004072 [Tulasnella sp. 418]|nr:hypothetical protein FRC02_004072 [Tulasnella sp. 418]